MFVFRTIVALFIAVPPFAAAIIYPSGEPRFTRRPTEGYPSAPAEGRNVVPAEWVRLTRNGDTLAAFQSKDGKFWRLIHSQAVPMPAKVLAGLFVSAGT